MAYGEFNKMTVLEKLQEMNDLFSIFDNPKDKFIQLMDMAKESEGLTDSEKLEINKINGCTSQAWVTAKHNSDGTFLFKTDSDAMIVKGLLALLETIFSNQTSDEILSINSPDILKSVGLDGAVTSQRTNGFSSAIEKIQGFVK
jgi:cysteine desulfuration protein SufE|tara:strand:- start:2460 stop:2891 length:432 start_codon:yes stop_codon:yes gene_type:complete